MAVSETGVRTFKTDPVPGQIFTEFFESSNITLSLGDVHQAAHGLSGRPKLWDVIFECIIAERDYSVGDHATAPRNGASGDPGSTAWVDDTNMGYIASTSIVISDKDGSTENVITEANWEIILRAWY